MESGRLLTTIRRNALRESNDTDTDSDRTTTIDNASLHPYYKQYLQKGTLPSEIKQFYSNHRYSPSKVWVLDISEEEDGIKSAGPFSSEQTFSAFIRDSTATTAKLLEKQRTYTRIFMIEKVSTWSAAIVGVNAKIPVAFFLDSALNEGITNSHESTRYKKVCIMDNFCIAAKAAENTRYISLDDPDKRVIQLARTHLYVTDSARTCHYGVVICNDIEYAASLITRCRSSYRSMRLLDTVQWLAWDLYHELNSWPDILKVSVSRLLREESKSRENPNLSLANDLHGHSSTLKGIEESIRSQRAILSDTFSETPSEGLDNCMKSLRERFERHLTLTGVLSEQVGVLTDFVFSTIQIQESVSVGRLTWVTIIFLPLSFVATLFSMSIRELDGSTSAWLYIICAIALLMITILIIYGMRYLPNWLATFRKKDSGIRAPDLDDHDLQDTESDTEDNDSNSLLCREAESNQATSLPDSIDAMSQPASPSTLRPRVERSKRYFAASAFLKRLEDVFDKRNSNGRIGLGPRNVLHVNDIALNDAQRNLHVVIIEEEQMQISSSGRQHQPPPSIQQLSYWSARLTRRLHEREWKHLGNDIIKDKPAFLDEHIISSASSCPKVEYSERHQFSQALDNNTSSRCNVLVHLDIFERERGFPIDSIYLVPAQTVDQWNKLMMLLKGFVDEMAHPASSLNIIREIDLGNIHVLLTGAYIGNSQTWGATFNNALTLAVRNSQKMINIHVECRPTAPDRDEYDLHGLYTPLQAPPSPEVISINVRIHIGGSRTIIPSHLIQTYQEVVEVIDDTSETLFLPDRDRKDRIVRGLIDGTQFVLFKGKIIHLNLWNPVFRQEAERLYIQGFPSMELYIEDSRKYAKRQVITLPTLKKFGMRRTTSNPELRMDWNGNPKVNKESKLIAKLSDTLLDERYSIKLDDAPQIVYIKMATEMEHPYNSYPPSPPLYYYPSRDINDHRKIRRQPSYDSEQMRLDNNHYEMNEPTSTSPHKVDVHQRPSLPRVSQREEYIAADFAARNNRQALKKEERNRRFGIFDIPE